MSHSQNASSERFNYNPALLGAVALGCGIILDRFWDLSFSVGLAISFFGLLFWFLAYRLFGNCRCAEPMGSLLLLIAVVGLGSSWHHGRWNWFSANDISQCAGDHAAPACIRAQVCSEGRPVALLDSDLLNPIPPQPRTRLEIAVQQIRDGDRWQDVAGRCELVVHAADPDIRPGDQVIIFGSLVRISPPSNPGQFDFHQYSRSRSRLVVVHAYFGSSVIVESRVTSLHPIWWLSTIRGRFNDLVWEYVGPKSAGLASAILLGNREQLTLSRRQEFMQTGTVHLLAISGLHVGILASFFFLLYRFGCTSRRTALLLTIAFVLFYAWLVEFHPPVTRATILVVLICVGRLIGKRAFGFNLLAIAAIVVLVMNPSDLFQVGPQLSFLAVAGIVCFRHWIFWGPSDEPLDRLVRTTRPMFVRGACQLGFRVRQLFLVSGLIWLLALPLVAFRFHLVALVGPVLNPLLLIPIALALYGGMGVFLFGGWLSPVAIVCGMICTVSLHGVELAIHWSEGLPLSHVWTVGPSALATSVFYLGFFALFVGLPKSKHKTWLPTAALVWLVGAWMVPATIQSHWQRVWRHSELRCTFVDVGHGTSVLIQTPDGRNMLYDAGTFGSPRFGYNNVAGLLWSEQVSHLDALVVSHADLDHFNAVPELCQRFSIGAVYVSPVMNDSSSKSVQLMLNLLKKKQIEIREVNWDMQLDIGRNVRGSVLSPPPGGTGETDNSDSIVLLIEVYGRKILLPGDLESVGMNMLLARPSVNCDVVMAPHHGSHHSRPAEFIDWACPEYVLISGHPKKVKMETLELLSEKDCIVNQTGSPGAVRYRIQSSGQISVEVFREGQWVAFSSAEN